MILGHKLPHFRFFHPSLSLCLSYLFLCKDDNAEQLILQTLHGDSEVDDGGLGAHLRGVGGVPELGGDVQHESLHHVHLLVTYFHLVGKESRGSSDLAREYSGLLLSSSVIYSMSLSLCSHQSILFTFFR